MDWLLLLQSNMINGDAGKDGHGRSASRSGSASDNGTSVWSVLRTLGKTLAALLLSLTVVVLASGWRESLLRASFASKEERFPVLDATGRRALGYFGELRPGLHALVNVVLAPVLPARLDAEPPIKAFEEAVRKHPRAAAVLGFDDEGDSSWSAGMRGLVRALNDGNMLTPLGRAGVQTRLTDNARVAAALLAFVEPRLDAQGKLPPLPVDPKRVVFLVGNYRGGTSALQRVMAAHPKALFMPAWATFAPISVANADEGRRDPQVLNATDPYNPYSMMSPEVAQINFDEHAIEPDLAEEDGLLWSPFLGLAPGMVSWETCAPRVVVAEGKSPTKTSALHPGIRSLGVFNASNTKAWERYFLKQVPTMLGAWLHRDSPLWTASWFARLREDPGTFLVLKAPMYAARLDLLRRAFPHARIVATHRDAVQAVRSLAVHQALICSIMCKHDDDDKGLDELHPADIALTTFDHFAVLAGGLATHKRVIDVNIPHSHVVRDIVGVATDILTGVGVSVSREDAQAMRAFDDKYRLRSKIKHVRSVESMGVDVAKEVAARPEFAAYERVGFSF